MYLSRTVDGFGSFQFVVIDSAVDIIVCVFRFPQGIFQRMELYRSYDMHMLDFTFFPT